LPRFFKIGGDARHAVDNNFLSDMRADCKHRNVVSRSMCYVTAQNYWGVVGSKNHYRPWEGSGIDGRSGEFRRD
jgi:hypothetical protein